MSDEPPRTGRSWTVRELMAALTGYPPETEVVVGVNDESTPPLGIYGARAGGVTDDRDDVISIEPGDSRDDFGDDLASCFKKRNRVVILHVDTLRQLRAWAGKR